MAYSFFSDTELACKCGSCDGKMNDAFMRKVVRLRTELDFPFAVSSAYRCPDYNDMVSSTGFDGPHTTGRAIDIRVSGKRAMRLLEAAIKAGFTGIGVSQKGAHGSRFIHLDDLDPKTHPRPALWSY